MEDNLFSRDRCPRHTCFLEQPLPLFLDCAIAS